MTSWLRAFSVLAFASVVLTTATVNAELVSYYNFNSVTDGQTEPIVADVGAGTISLSGWTGGVDNFSGTTLNNFGGAPAGSSLSLVGQNGNGSFIQVNASLAGLQDAVISFATRGTGTGFNSGIWSYSTNGTDYTDVDGNTSSNSGYSVKTVDLTGVTELTNAASVSFRYTLDGASSNNGNNRIDNLQLNASAVPEPSALLYGAMFAASTLGFRRRRK